MIAGCHDNAALTISSYFAHKFFERHGICHIDHRVCLAAMTIAARNDRFADAFGKIDNGLIFLPRAETIYFKGVDPLRMVIKKAA